MLTRVGVMMYVVVMASLIQNCSREGEDAQKRGAQGKSEVGSNSIGIPGLAVTASREGTAVQALNIPSTYRAPSNLNIAVSLGYSFYTDSRSQNLRAWNNDVSGNEASRIYAETNSLNGRTQGVGVAIAASVMASVASKPDAFVFNQAMDTPPADCISGPNSRTVPVSEYAPVNVGTILGQTKSLDAPGYMADFEYPIDKNYSRSYYFRVCVKRGSVVSQGLVVGPIVTANSAGQLNHEGFREGPPPAPTNLTVSGISSTGFSLNWNSAGGTTVGFVRKIIQGAAKSIVCNAGAADIGSQSSTTISGLTAGTYTVAICSYDNIHFVSTAVSTIVTLPDSTGRTQTPISLYDFSSQKCQLPYSNQQVLCPKTFDQYCADAGQGFAANAMVNSSVDTIKNFLIDGGSKFFNHGVEGQTTIYSVYLFCSASRPDSITPTPAPLAPPTINSLNLPSSDCSIDPYGNGSLLKCTNTFDSYCTRAGFTYAKSVFLNNGPYANESQLLPAGTKFMTVSNHFASNTGNLGLICIYRPFGPVAIPVIPSPMSLDRLTPTSVRASWGKAASGLIIGGAQSLNNATVGFIVNTASGTNAPACDLFHRVDAQKLNDYTFSYDVNGLTANTIFTISICGYNSDGEISPARVLTFRTPSSLSTVPTPSRVSLGENGFTGVSTDYSLETYAPSPYFRKDLGSGWMTGGGTTHHFVATLATDTLVAPECDSRSTAGKLVIVPETGLPTTNPGTFFTVFSLNSFNTASDKRQIVSVCAVDAKGAMSAPSIAQYLYKYFDPVYVPGPTPVAPVISAPGAPGSPTLAAIVNVTDSAFSKVGSWNLDANASPKLYYTSAGNGSNNVTYTISNLKPGKYRVSANWNGNGNHATNVPYTLKDGGKPVNTTTANQQPASNDFVDQGAGWKILFNNQDINSGSMQLVLTNNANQYVIAGAIRLDFLSAPVVEPVSLDPPATPTSVKATADLFKIKLTWSSASAATSYNIYRGTSAGGEAVTPIKTGVTGNTFADSPGTPGIYYYTISAVNALGESDKSSEVSAAMQTVAVININDGGFAKVGNWGLDANARPSLYYAPAGNGSISASYTIAAGLPPGMYRIAAIWNAHSNHATNVKYSIKDGANIVSTVTVNQQPLPNDFSDMGFGWKTLVDRQLINSGSLQVSLNNNANQYIIASSLRIEYLGQP